MSELSVSESASKVNLAILGRRRYWGHDAQYVRTGGKWGEGVLNNQGEWSSAGRRRTMTRDRMRMVTGAG